jgi:hypothetical protein
MNYCGDIKEQRHIEREREREREMGILTRTGRTEEEGGGNGALKFSTV